MIYFTSWGCFRQSTTSFAVDHSKLGCDVSLLFVGHLALGYVCKRAPFSARPYDLESDAQRARLIKPRVLHFGPAGLMDRSHVIIDTITDWAGCGLYGRFWNREWAQDDSYAALDKNPILDIFGDSKAFRLPDILWQTSTKVRIPFVKSKRMRTWSAALP